jgi:mono/diheme cytochrome c family protein
MEKRHSHTSSIANKPAWRARFLYRVILSRAACFFVPLAVAATLMVAGSCTMAQSAAHSSKADETPAGNAENGKKLFAKYGCYECHGREAQGGGLNGPRLAPDPVPISVLQSYLRHPQGEMPPYTDKVVSDKDLADIYAFLQSMPQHPSAKTIPILKH